MSEGLPELTFFCVADLIMSSTPTNSNIFIKSVSSKSEIDDLGFSTEAKGIQIHRDETKILLSTKKIDGRSIEEFEMKDRGTRRTPLLPGITLPPLNKVPDVIYIENYRKLLGKLRYLFRCVRFDICYATSLLSRF